MKRLDIHCQRLTNTVTYIILTFFRKEYNILYYNNLQRFDLSTLHTGFLVNTVNPQIYAFFKTGEHTSSFDTIKHNTFMSVTE